MFNYLKTLQKRKVIGLVSGYVLLAWIIMQVLEVMIPAMRLPEMLNTLTAYVLVMLFPFVALAAWMWDFKRAEAVAEKHGSDAARKDYSEQAKRQLNMLIAGGIVLALTLFVVNRWVFKDSLDTVDAPVIASVAVEAVADAPETEAELNGAMTAAADETGNEATGSSIAVLPFAVGSTEEADIYFADGLVEEIIVALGHVPDLMVVSRSSSFFFKDKDTPAREIADTLNVSHLLEGSVRNDGSNVRITVRLLEANSQAVIWSNVYEDNLANTFTVQTDIAKNVATALGIFLDEQQQELLNSTGVRDVESFVAYQRGLTLYAKAHDDLPLQATLQEANLEFDRVLAANPEYTQAHLRKVDLFTHMLMDQLPDDPDADSYRDALRQISISLAEAYRSERDVEQKNMIRANMIFLSPDWSDLSSSMDAALNNAESCMTDLWLSDVGPVYGKAEQSFDWNLKRLSCSRLDPAISTFSAFSALMMGEPDIAEDILQSQEQILGSRMLDTTLLIQTHLASGDTDSAATIYEALPDPGNLLKVQYHAATGGEADMREALIALQGEEGTPVWVVLPALAVAGERAAANALAGAIDETPLGPAVLSAATSLCLCGAPFELTATPNFSDQLNKGGLPWPPASPISWPYKAW